jgi:hypothetical protein
MKLKVLELEMDYGEFEQTLASSVQNGKFLRKTSNIEVVKKAASKYVSQRSYDYQTEAIKEIIKHFKKKGNAETISKAFEERYVYSFEDLCVVIDTLESLNLLHKVWFKPVKNFEGCWKIQFDELL